MRSEEITLSLIFHSLGNKIYNLDHYSNFFIVLYSGLNGRNCFFRALTV